MRFLFTSLIILACINSVAFAGLEWKINNVVIKSELGDEKAVGVYAFTNNGEKPITATSVRPSQVWGLPFS